MHSYFRKDASFGAHHKKLNEDRHYQRQKRMLMTLASFWRYMVYADIRGDVLGRGVTVGLSFSLAKNFGNFRDEASVIQRYAVRRQLFSDPKVHDLE